MKLPNFFIIGAAKSGTTSMHGLLSQHPNVFMPEEKEPEFFARNDLYEKGIESYASIFEDARGTQVIGEASTIYSLSPFFPKTAERIKLHTPNAKIIYIMREPVSRSFSFYAQLLKNYQRETGDYAVHRSFEDMIYASRDTHIAPRGKVYARFDDHYPDDLDLCLRGSDYLFQIQCYLQHFSRSQMLFLKFEDFKRAEFETMRIITDFLGVEPLTDTVFTACATPQNTAASHFKVLQEVNRINKAAVKLGRLWSLRTSLPTPLRLKLRNLYIKMSRQTSVDNGTPVAMSSETHAALSYRFAPDFAALSDLTGLDLSEWSLAGC